MHSIGVRYRRPKCAVRAGVPSVCDQPSNNASYGSRGTSEDMKGNFAITLFHPRAMLPARHASKTPCASRDPYLRPERSCGTSVWSRTTRPRHPPRSSLSATTVVVAHSWSSFDARAFTFRRRQPFACGRRAKPLSCCALFYALRVTRVVGPPSSDGLSRLLFFDRHSHRRIRREANPLLLDVGDQPEV